MQGRPSVLGILAEEGSPPAIITKKTLAVGGGRRGFSKPPQFIDGGSPKAPSLVHMADQIDTATHNNHGRNGPKK